jgi:hypothetical protein
MGGDDIAFHVVATALKTRAFLIRAMATFRPNFRPNFRLDKELKLC